MKVIHIKYFPNLTVVILKVGFKQKKGVIYLSLRRIIF